MGAGGEEWREGGVSRGGENELSEQWHDSGNLLEGSFSKPGGSLFVNMTNWHVPSWGLVGRRHDVMCKLIGFHVYDQEQIITN